jgi:VanZ family protein
MPDSQRHFLMRPRTWQIALVGYWLALFVSTHVPSSVPMLSKGGFDKLVHVAAFAALAALLAITWQLAAGHLTIRHLFAAWLVLLIYAALDEWTQTLVGRHASARDWLADAAGALVALALFAWWRPRISARR